jgi:sugar phosphate isomerase/epimerase
MVATEVPAPVPGVPIGWCALPEGKALADAKSAGFEFVELALQEVLTMSDQDFERVAGEVRASGLKILSGYNPVPRELKIVGPEANPEKLDEHLRRLVQRAAALKVTYLVFNSGPAWRIPEDFSQKVAGAQLVDFSRRFATAAAEQGITVLVLPVRSVDSNQVTSVASALKLVELVNHPNFELMVDYSFLRIQKDNPAALLKAGSHLRHVHIANPAPTGRSFPLADTESDYAAFFNVLKEIGYRGGIGIHAGTNAFADEAPRSIAFLRRAASTLVEK